MEAIELNTDELAMRDSVRMNHMFVEIEPGLNGFRKLVISHRGSTTRAEYSPNDKARMKELSKLYGVVK